MTEELWTYLDPEEKNPQPILVEYTGEERLRIFKMAAWYTRRLQKV